MGFCSKKEYREFLRACPLFEEMLIRSGITLIKYWFSVNDQEQEKRFQERMRNPIKRWKLSPMDIESPPALGRLLQSEGRDARPYGYQKGPGTW
jgi:polyphosphate kinase 2 (PPK2 family)